MLLETIYQNPKLQENVCPDLLELITNQAIADSRQTDILGVLVLSSFQNNFSVVIIQTLCSINSSKISCKKTQSYPKISTTQKFISRVDNKNL